jgi:hypothetical protein
MSGFEGVLRGILVGMVRRVVVAAASILVAVRRARARYHTERVLALLPASPPTALLHRRPDGTRNLYDHYCSAVQALADA